MSEYYSRFIFPHTVVNEDVVGSTGSGVLSGSNLLGNCFLCL